MKTLNVEAYERIYSDQEYLDADDYSDLVTLLVNEYERSHERFYKEFKLDRRKKKIGDDEDQKVLHKLALQIEVGLDASARQFYARLQPPDQMFMNEKYFSQSFVKPNEDKSSANSLQNKFVAIRKFIKEFQNRHKLELRKSYRYKHGRLYYTPAKYVKFKQNGYPSALLDELFKDLVKVHDSEELVERIAENYPFTYARKDLDDLAKIKRTCELINKRVSKETKNNTQLVLHNAKTTSLNPMAFDQIDRIQFDNNR
jgi:hypothetical protein